MFHLSTQVLFSLNANNRRRGLLFFFTARSFRQKTMHLMPLGDTAKDMESLEFLGAHLPPHLAEGMPPLDNNFSLNILR